jgi:hypothetical protein
MTRMERRRPLDLDSLHAFPSDEDIEMVRTALMMQKLRFKQEEKEKEEKRKSLQFDAEKIRPVPSRFDPDKMRYEYAVVDLRNFPDMEKIWTVSKKTSDIIDEKLAEGHSILLVECEGEGTSRKFKISPRD